MTDDTATARFLSFRHHFTICVYPPRWWRRDWKAQAQRTSITAVAADWRVNVPLRNDVTLTVRGADRDDAIAAARLRIATWKRDFEAEYAQWRERPLSHTVYTIGPW